ncbi:MAG: twin-arginine translocase subunit TatC, partial [Clostridiales bacterium]|nr:twin-arginine translocase subunit TatC [Clostridiales bacterium]
ALSYARVIKSKSLIKNRRYMILLIFIAAALVTPPDPLSLMLLASPLLVLYEISIIFARIRDRSLDKAVTPTFTKSGQMVMPKGYEEASKIKTQEALAEIGLTMEDMEKMGNQMISALKHHDPEPEPEPEPEPDYDKNE